MVLKTEARQLADLILKPIVTEKATLLLEQNKYVFDVALKATKPEIQAATPIQTRDRDPSGRRLDRPLSRRITTKKPDNGKLNYGYSFF